MVGRMNSAFRASAFLLVSTAGLLASVREAAAVDPLYPGQPCSVFDPIPCTPSFCGVYGPWPCVPALPPVSSGLRLTVHSRGTAGAQKPDGPINSIGALYRALQACWEAPPLEEAHRGMEMSVRLSFKRTGGTIAPPRVTYTSSEANTDTRRAYRQAIDAALERCTPMPFSQRMGAAVAGQPIAIRFVDDRNEGEH
jgi:hypothetical protein